MRTDEVPQDAGYLEDHKRGAYAVGSDGKYQVIATKGWNAETEATAVALRDADAKVAAAWKDAQSGRRSSLHYHLAAKLMTPALLATYAGTTRLSVWWHCRPGPFAKLSAERREAYARALRLSVAALMVLPAKPESLL